MSVRPLTTLCSTSAVADDELMAPRQAQPQPRTGLGPQQEQEQVQREQQREWQARQVQQSARLIEDNETAINKISNEVQELSDLFVSLGGLVEQHAQPIETIQSAAHAAAERTKNAVVELQTTADKQADCVVQ